MTYVYGSHHLRLTHKFLRTPHVTPIVSSRSTLHNIYDHSRKTAVRTPRIYQILDILLLYESQSPFISCEDERLGRTAVICAQCVHVCTSVVNRRFPTLVTVLVSMGLCTIIRVNGTCYTQREFYCVPGHVSCHGSFNTQVSLHPPGTCGRCL